MSECRPCRRRASVAHCILTRESAGSEDPASMHLMRIPSRILVLSLGLGLATLALPARPSAQQTPASAIVIRGVTLIDGTGRTPVTNATVLVEGTRITQVSTQQISAPAGAQVVDGRGKFLIPGLIDVHVHLNGGGNRASTQPITPQQIGRA